MPNTAKVKMKRRSRRVRYTTFVTLSITVASSTRMECTNLTSFSTRNKRNDRNMVDMPDVPPVIEGCVAWSRWGERGRYRGRGEGRGREGWKRGTGEGGSRHGVGKGTSKGARDGVQCEMGL